MEQKTMDRTTIKGIRWNFSTQPLKDDDLDKFYVNTLEARMGSSRNSPIKDIYEACTGNGAEFTHLLLGHMGCGKSTEINKLEKQFKDDGYTVKKYDLLNETNIRNLKVEDILILITDALLGFCKDKQIEIHENDVKKLIFFFAEEEDTITKETEKKFSAEVGGGFSFSKIISFVAEIKARIQNTTKEMTVIRNKIDKRFSEWNNCIENIIEKIRQQDNGKYPIVIFENFDKIPVKYDDGKIESMAINLFANGNLTSINTYMIYTFPINASYDAKFRSITAYAAPHIFPMIDVKSKTGDKNKKGFDVIKKVIEKRADLNLFDEEALDLIIEKTGGSLRDIFRCVAEAAKYAGRGDNMNKITAEEVIMALNDEKYNFLTRRITMKDYPALNQIHRTKAEIADFEKMNWFLEAHVVLEYNGTRWHDLHPLIFDFMMEHGRIE